MIAAPVLEHLAEDRRRGVIHDQRYAELAPDIGNLLDREDAQLRVGQGLGVIGAGLGIGRLGEGLGILRIDETGLDAHVLEGVGEEIPGAAVEIRGADDIVAGLGDVLHGDGRCRLAGGEGERGDAAFERREALLQHVGRRIHDPGIDVAERLQPEQVRGMLGAVVELVGCRPDRSAPPRR